MLDNKRPSTIEFIRLVKEFRLLYPYIGKPELLGQPKKLYRIWTKVKCKKCLEKYAGVMFIYAQQGLLVKSLIYVKIKVRVKISAIHATQKIFPTWYSFFYTAHLL